MFEPLQKVQGYQKIIEAKQNQDQNWIKQCLEMSRNISIYALRL